MFGSATPDARDAAAHPLSRKLAILADAAKYDASCASSGSKRNRTPAKDGIGSTEGMGICHSYTPDGRCVSLLKILLTNLCIYDCAYCINRRSSSVERERFTPEEVVRLTLDFYRRNYIEGLFLSSGIIRSSDHTMEQLARVARMLRVDHGFQGYIHLKTIPDAAPELIAEAGRWADRLSINVELPSQRDLTALAPEKDLVQIRRAMSGIRERIDEAKVPPARRPGAVAARRSAVPPRFAPAGQSTQMIIGATDATDRTILHAASALYGAHKLRRVYYSAFSPIPDPMAGVLPIVAPPLMREHRLYQADWLLRFYGFSWSELLPDDAPNLDLAIDPKLAWALRHRGHFPVDVNRAPRELLLRVPGLGARSVNRILKIRQWHRLRLDDLMRLNIPLRRTLPFVTAADRVGSALTLDCADLRASLTPRPEQLDMFGAAPASVASGQL